MIYVYAIADQPGTPLPRQSGLCGQSLSKVIWCDIAAVVSAYDGAAPPQGADDVWRHEAVVESLMNDCTVVPMRFGTLAPSRRQLDDILCRKYRALAADIERVRGCVEIGLRFLSTIDEDAEADRPSRCDDFELSRTGRGSAYLFERVAEERRWRERQRDKLKLVRDAYERVASYAREGRFDDGADDRRGVAAALLVPRDRLAVFREAIGDVADANPELAMLCTGPWPPYSFVGAHGHAATSRGKPHHAE